MRFLLDGNVLSELRKADRCDLNVRSWFDAQFSDDLAISVITLGEISAGIAQKALNDAVQARRLQQWLDQMQLLYANRILPVTDVIAVRWGTLSPIQPIAVADGLLAATALDHNLVCVTRNVRHFERSGVRLLNPWENHS